MFGAQAQQWVQLLLAVSESWLGCGAADGHVMGLQHAERALAVAEAEGTAAAAAAAAAADASSQAGRRAPLDLHPRILKQTVFPFVDLALSTAGYVVSVCHGRCHEAAGDSSEAQRCYRRAADEGSPAAALALARLTGDPAPLRSVLDAQAEACSVSCRTLCHSP